MQKKGKWSCPRATAQVASAFLALPVQKMTEDFEPPRGDVTFTIFTPTYNRADTLARLFDSICSQGRYDFEWLIVDDGSDDGTDRLVGSFARAATFPVRYIYQPNSGKYVAFNTGVNEARGQMFLTIDSDDELTPDALELMYAAWIDIPSTERHLFTGVTARCIDQEGNIVGSERLPSPIDTDSATATFIMKMSGERIGFHRTDVLRGHLFPKDVPTRFIPEGRLWLDIARHYKTRFIEAPARVFHDHREERLSNLDRVVRARGDAEYYRFALSHYVRLFFQAPREVVKLAVGLRRAELHLGLRADRSAFPVAARVMAWLASPVAWIAYAQDMYTRYGALGRRLVIGRLLLHGKGGRTISNLLMSGQKFRRTHEVLVHACGVVIEVDAADSANHELLISPGTANHQLLRFYSRRMKNVGAAAVLGRNVSYVACHIARLAKPNASIIAIESETAQTARTGRSARASYANGLRTVTQNLPDPKLLYGCEAIHFQDEATALTWSGVVWSISSVAVVTFEFDASSQVLRRSALLAGFALVDSVPGQFNAWERVKASPVQKDSA